MLRNLLPCVDAPLMAIFGVSYLGWIEEMVVAELVHVTIACNFIPRMSRYQWIGDGGRT